MSQKNESMNDKKAGHGDGTVEASSSVPSMRGGEVSGLGGGDQGMDNLGKIREILFGTQMRDYDRRFVDQESSFAQEVADLREEVKARLTSLEKFIKKEIEVLSDRQHGQHQELSSLIAGVEHQSRESDRVLESRCRGIEDESKAGRDELHRQMLDEVGRLEREMVEERKNLTDYFEEQLAEVRLSLTQRHALADMLSDVAERLKGAPSAEFVSGGGDKGKKGKG